MVLHSWAASKITQDHHPCAFGATVCVVCRHDGANALMDRCASTLLACLIANKLARHSTFCCCSVPSTPQLHIAHTVPTVGARRLALIRARGLIRLYIDLLRGRGSSPPTPSPFTSRRSATSCRALLGSLHRLVLAGGCSAGALLPTDPPGSKRSSTCAAPALCVLLYNPASGTNRKASGSSPLRLPAWPRSGGGARSPRTMHRYAQSTTSTLRIGV